MSAELLLRTHTQQAAIPPLLFAAGWRYMFDYGLPIGIIASEEAWETAGCRYLRTILESG
jgi:hypothetical protein